jgi:predicted dehydrogenase
MQVSRTAPSFRPQPASRISRRRFLSGGATAITALTVVPSHVLGLGGAASPNNKLNIACIGVGGRGGDNVRGVSSENIVALCDVDSRQAAKTFERFPNAKRFQDYRRMLDQVSREIDAVVVSTPDHTHAVALMNAIKRGKHVYSEKPLAHSLGEVRALMRAARQYKVVTQLGNQGHSFDSIRDFVTWVQAGTIGAVREVHAFCGSSYSKIRQLGIIKERHPVPATLDWDSWLGPAAYRNYHPAYLPGAWRGWMAFGTGVVGDWTCHVVDPVFWALNLSAPTHVQAEATDYDPLTQGETFPRGCVIHHEFAARGSRPPLKLTWYDGDRRPPRPEELGPGQELPGIGALVIGDKGKLVYGSHGAGGVKLIPDSRMKEFQEPPSSILRSPGHHQEWVRACKGGPAAGSAFDYGGPLTEIALLGIIALRFKGQRLAWDAASARFANCPEANRFVNPPYRQGWSL